MSPAHPPLLPVRAPRTELTATPRGLRLHIGLFGRRNVGKSSLLNALTHQQTSLVSAEAGTTTDPVEKPMELLPLGPVLFIDTAGIDDEGDLGELRVQRTRQVIGRTELAIVVTDEPTLGAYERWMLREFEARSVPVVLVFNKVDKVPIDDASLAELSAAQRALVVRASASEERGIAELRAALSRAAPEAAKQGPTLLSDLVGAGQLAVLVVPVDKEAPKGRLILPQAQAIRDLLDGDAMCLVVKVRELPIALGALKEPPKLVVTDSQAFREVAAVVPRSILMTGFSVLFARLKGDLTEQVIATMAVDSLKPGDRVLMVEACTHHPIEDDIGRVKIPRWLSHYVGGELRFEYTRGHDFPQDLRGVKLAVHCGACMLNRKEVQTRLAACRDAGVPMTNYGLTIAYSLGVFERALEPFPTALAAYRERLAARPSAL